MAPRVAWPPETFPQRTWTLGESAVAALCAWVLRFVPVTWKLELLFIVCEIWPISTLFLPQLSLE